MEDFSSLKFQDIYMKSPLSASVKINKLDIVTTTYEKLVISIDNVMEYVNNHGGFTVVGWYRRGEIKDISSEEIVHHVDSSEVGYKIISLYPTRMNLINMTEWNSLKFDFNQIQVVEQESNVRFQLDPSSENP